MPWPLWDGVGGDEVSFYQLKKRTGRNDSVHCSTNNADSKIQTQQVINETDRLGVIGYLCQVSFT